MTAPAVGVRGRWSPDQLELYRDDGPLARRLGAVAALPAVALAALGALPLLAAIALRGDEASHALAAGALGWAVLAGGASSGRPQEGRLAWAVVPLLRLTEYAGILWLAALAGDEAAPAAFALLGAVAFRQYDLVYRLRHQGAAPPAWVGNLAGGWDGRLLGGLVLLLAGALPAGFFMAAGLMAALFVAESIAGWQGATVRPMPDDDEEDEDA